MYKKLGYVEEISFVYDNLSKLYSAKGEYKKALECYKLYTQSNDSVFSLSKNKELTRYEMNYEFDKKDAVKKAEQDKKDAVTMAQSRKLF